MCFPLKCLHTLISAQSSTSYSAASVFKSCCVIDHNLFSHQQKKPTNKTKDFFRFLPIKGTLQLF